MMTYPEFKPGWFSVRTHPKHERIAASHLARLDGVEVYCPRVRLTKAIRHKKTEVVEALFPNYVFARFDLRESLDLVRYAQGVSTVVHFGHRYPMIPEAEIDGLRERFDGADEVKAVEELSPGQRVRIIGRAFVGVSGVVSEYMSARQRVNVLIEMLGRTTMVELGVDSVVAEGHPRDRLAIA